MPRKKIDTPLVEETEQNAEKKPSGKSRTRREPRQALAPAKLPEPPAVTENSDSPAKPAPRKRSKPKTAKPVHEVSAPEVAEAPPASPVATAPANPEAQRTRSRSRSKPSATDKPATKQPESTDSGAATLNLLPESGASVITRVIEAPVSTEDVKKPERSPRNRRTSQRGKTPAPPAAAKKSHAPKSSDQVEPYDPELDLPEPIWRPRQERESAAKVVEKAEPVVVPEETEESAQRRSRRRRRGRKTDSQEPVAATPVEAAATEAPVQEETPEVEPAPTIFRKRRITPPPSDVKQHIPIPDTAPQVVVRNGVPTLVRNHRVYPPLIFFGNPSDERRANTVFDELRMAAEAGVHIHSFLVDLEVDSKEVDASIEFAAYLLARSVEIDPEAQVLFRLTFKAPNGWQHTYPNARYRTLDGRLAEPSVSDDEFWNVAKECLTTFTKRIRLLDLRDHILGVHLDRGEWFLPEGTGYDDSKAAQQKFRDWVRTRYLDDEVTFRASWFDGTVRFDSVQIPEYQPEGTEGEKFIRSSRKQRRYVDYHLFLSDTNVHRIGDLAYAVKAASEGNFLVGVSYGYTFEWSHPASGHLALGKLLRTDEVDFIGGPPSYRNREPGGSAPFPAPIDSFALNGKLYISEEDFKTSLSQGQEPDDFNPQLKTPQALESVHWRGLGAALAHASGMAWMDLWGTGWLRTSSVWERARRASEVLIDRMAAPVIEPDVAVFIDERALAYLVDPNAFTLLVQNVRESVLRAGVNAAFYLLSDLQHRERFPESKLYLFLNAWDIRPDLRAAIKSRLQKDNKVLLWLYSAGLFDAGRDSLERAREVTGIALKPQPFYSRAGTTILNRRHPLSEAFPDRSLIGGTKLDPSYFAIPEGATVLGEYSQTGLPSFVVREFKEDPEAQWTSVFLGEPLVNPALIRALAQMAGAHVWNFHEDVVHVRAPFCTVHCSGAGPRTITLPDKYSAFNLLTGQWAAVDSTNLRFTAVDGSTHVFLVGPRVELEHFLRADPQDLLTIEQLPPRESNVRVDSSNFDVPIMRLDEWIEGSDDDEVDDEWFLRPPRIEEEEAPAPAEESPESIGRRRRRRRRRPGDRGPSDDAPSSSFASPFGDNSEDDDMTMGVVFRKKD